MQLIKTFQENKHNVGLNFASIERDNAFLKEIGFIFVKMTVDMGKKNCEAKMYDLVSQYFSPESIVFMTSPDHVVVFPLLYNTVVSITNTLPYMVYFKTSIDPEKRNPFVLSGEHLRYRISEAQKLQVPLSCV